MTTFLSDFLAYFFPSVVISPDLSYISGLILLLCVVSWISSLLSRIGGRAYV